MPSLISYSVLEMVIISAIVCEYGKNSVFFLNIYTNRDLYDCYGNRYDKKNIRVKKMWL